MEAYDTLTFSWQEGVQIIGALTAPQTNAALIKHGGHDLPLLSSTHRSVFRVWLLEH